MQGRTSFDPVQERTTSAEHPVILVVDDCPSIRDMLSWWLRLQGYQPACTANGQEALQWLEQTPHAPQAILLDWFMPVMSGKQFLATLHAYFPLPLPPVILITVETSNQDLTVCRAVLRKPFHLRDLAECLRQAAKAYS